MNTTLSIEQVKEAYALSQTLGEGVSLNLNAHRFESRAVALEVAEEIKKVLGIEYKEFSVNDEDGSAHWFKFQKGYSGFEIALFYKIPTDSEVLTIVD